MAFDFKWKCDNKEQGKHERYFAACVSVDMWNNITKEVIDTWKTIEDTQFCWDAAVWFLEQNSTFGSAPHSSVSRSEIIDMETFIILLCNIYIQRVLVLILS